MISISSHDETSQSGIDPAETSAPSADDLPAFIPSSWVKSHEDRVKNIEKACGRLERQVADLSATIARIDARTNQTERSLEGVGRLVRTPSGATLGNVLEDVREMTKKIKRKVVDEPF